MVTSETRPHTSVRVFPEMTDVCDSDRARKEPHECRWLHLNKREREALIANLTPPALQGRLVSVITNRHRSQQLQPVNMTHTSSPVGSL